MKVNEGDGSVTIRALKPKVDYEALIAEAKRTWSYGSPFSLVGQLTRALEAHREAMKQCGKQRDRLQRQVEEMRQEMRLCSSFNFSKQEWEPNHPDLLARLDKEKP